MLFADRLTIGERRRTKEGYLAVRARAARAGIYDYLGREVDPEGNHFAADQVVKVYRPESEVFAKDAVHSFMLKPITDDHPKSPVSSSNWQDLAKGVNAGAMRDGEYLAFDLVFMDKGLIQSIDGGKRELSNGYASEIEIADGETDDGQHYDAIQRNIRGNHIAVVDKGRAGAMCRISDEAVCDSIPVDLLERLIGDERTYSATNDGNTNDPTNVVRQSGENKMPHTLIIDGFQVNDVSDQAKVAIEKLQGQVRDANEARTKAEGDIATANTTIAARDAEIVNLKKEVEDSKVTPAQLRSQAKAYANVCDKAKALGVKFTEDADAADIMKAVVEAKMGDTAKAYDDKQVAAAFDVLTKDAKVATDPVRNVLSGGVETISDERANYEKVRDAARKNLSDGWRQPASTDA